MAVGSKVGSQVMQYKEQESLHREELGWMDVSNKHMTLTQETAVCVPCETESQH